MVGSASSAAIISGCAIQELRKGLGGEKDREIEREKGRAWGKKKERRERRNA